MTAYDQLFYKYINIGAERSSKQLVPFLLNRLKVQSVLDVGCGQGVWLKEYLDCGVEVGFGIDGDYIRPENMVVDSSLFSATDLSTGFDLKRKFDLVQSLEVAEHIAEANADQFIESIVKHGDIVLFSAAAKGQGGDHHINEQDYDYWREKFRYHDYLVYDCIRPELLENTEVEPWYRYNTFLYVASSFQDQLPERICSHHVPDTESLKDVSPAWYKARKSIISLLPYRVRNMLARFKAYSKAKSNYLR